MKVYAKNKSARHRYEILETYEAGIKLKGHEVKSIRNAQASLKGSYVTFHEGEAYIINMHVSQYKYSRELLSYDPERKRKLLLKKSQIKRLQGKSKEPGLTIVPLSLYNNGRYIKVKIGVVKGKKKHDKREKMKRRDQKREAERAAKEMSTNY